MAEILFLSVSVFLVTLLHLEIFVNYQHRIEFFIIIGFLLVSLLSKIYETIKNKEK